MRFRTAPRLVRFNWGTGLLALMSPWPRQLPPIFLPLASRPLRAPSDPYSNFFSLLRSHHLISHRLHAGFRRPRRSLDRGWLYRERLITSLPVAMEDISARDTALGVVAAGEAAAVEGGEGSQWRRGLRTSQRLSSPL